MINIIWLEIFPGAFTKSLPSERQCNMKIDTPLSNRKKEDVFKWG